MAKIFNIKVEKDSDAELFRSLVKQTTLTQGQFFNLLMEKYQNISLTPSEINTGLTEEIARLKEANQILQKDLATATETAQNNFAQANTLTLQNEALTAEIETLKQSGPQPLTGSQFVFDPSAVKRPMQRAISFQIKKGKINRHENQITILQNFTAEAIKYYVKNEFPEVL